MSYFWNPVAILNPLQIDDWQGLDIFVCEGWEEGPTGISWTKIMYPTAHRPSLPPLQTAETVEVGKPTLEIPKISHWGRGTSP